MPDLWPDDIGTATVTPPVAILREQAAALGNKTKNLVEGEVVQVTPENLERFWYVFNIVGPALGGYRYRLLTIRFPVEMYPVDVLLEPEILTHVRAKLVLNIPDNALARALENLGRDELRAKSEDEFKAVLKGVFNAPKTRRVIEAILAQSMR